MEYHMEYLHQEEVYIVAESPIGHRRWMIEYPLAQKYEVQHELGRRRRAEVAPSGTCGSQEGAQRMAPLLIDSPAAGSPRLVRRAEYAPLQGPQE
jgi:hypothetical protein